MEVGRVNLRWISTHAPRTGSDPRASAPAYTSTISTHAPRTGSDRHLDVRVLVVVISTHAPRTGSDPRSRCRCAAFWDFNPRSPHGERRAPLTRETPRVLFQPTLPARGATLAIRQAFSTLLQFQPTLPARGATAFLCLAARAYSNFNPRSPHGERRPPAPGESSRRDFNPRSPHGERPNASSR